MPALFSSQPPVPMAAHPQIIHKGIEEERVILIPTYIKGAKDRPPNSPT